MLFSTQALVQSREYPSVAKKNSSKVLAQLLTKICISWWINHLLSTSETLCSNPVKLVVIQYFN